MVPVELRDAARHTINSRLIQEAKNLTYDSEAPICRENIQLLLKEAHTLRIEVCEEKIQIFLNQILCEKIKSIDSKDKADKLENFLIFINDTGLEADIKPAQILLYSWFEKQFSRIKTKNAPIAETMISCAELLGLNVDRFTLRMPK
ncbi:MAG: hypothetical protein P9M03_02210 [Candidatus Theseobacter exili]|nr:hypothetical protein [Candidatus Theseobacter exili]